jgi:hypothetical protein
LQPSGGAGGGAGVWIFEAVRADERCIVASRGREPCGEEFADLDLAQAQYERAVVEYSEACRQ